MMSYTVVTTLFRDKHKNHAFTIIMSCNKKYHRSIFCRETSEMEDISSVSCLYLSSDVSSAVYLNIIKKCRIQMSILA